MKKEILIAAGASLISLAVGAVGGYLYAKRSLDALYNEKMELEIERTRQYYKTLHKKEEFSTPESAAEALLPEGFEKADSDEEIPAVALETAQRVLYEQKYKKQPVEEIVTSIFKENPADASEEAFQASVAKRTTMEPYVIHHDEFMGNEKEYRQITVTFYEADEVLVDEENSEPIAKAEKTLGVVTPPFGMWSKDQNVVYIRNDALQAEFEVLRHQGSYAEVVLGLTPHPKVGR